jgi:hypothetical protein
MAADDSVWGTSGEGGQCRMFALDCTCRADWEMVTTSLESRFFMDDGA